VGVCLHERMSESVREKRKRLRETLEDRFHRQQGYVVKRVRTDRNTLTEDQALQMTATTVSFI
jgi:hypothetical protein